MVDAVFFLIYYLLPLEAVVQLGVNWVCLGVKNQFFFSLKVKDSPCIKQLHLEGVRPVLRPFKCKSNLKPVNIKPTERYVTS